MIHIDIKKANQIERLLSRTPEQANQVLARSINSSAVRGKQRAATSVRKVYSVERLGALKDLKILRASPSYLRAILKSTGTPIPLIKFDTIPKIPDVARVKARVMKSNSHKSIDSAFVSQMNNAHINVFERVGKSRTPIRGLYSPSLPQMYGNEDVVEDVDKVIAEKLSHELEKALGKMLWG
ncbi:hypothetical protein OXB_2980 [Bacillus sp. OxB-1]|uniref:phage tail protein n=1 Tax=Bacillus sp. (strain OxB-1) TaxID=98228 RepID=UPI000581E2F9|nr:phage tail protein [Bacillus sp. OxB-1]BAQ11450.1 hypothetical protein OXB_2980 [Bacillus sp. OxB-1]